MSLLERDIRFLKARLPDQINLGIFLVDCSEFRERLLKQLDQLFSQIKQMLYTKLQQVLLSNEKMGKEIFQKLDKNPKTIEDFIKLNLYLESDELKQYIETMENYIDMANMLYYKLEEYYVKLQDDDIPLYMSSGNLLREVVRIKGKTQKTQQDNRSKFKSMHDEKKRNVKEKIKVSKQKMEEIKLHYQIEEAHDVARDIENIKYEYNIMKEQIKELQFEENNLALGYDAELDLEDFFEDFEQYAKIWKFASDWKFVSPPLPRARAPSPKTHRQSQ